MIDILIEIETYNTFNGMENDNYRTIIFYRITVRHGRNICDGDKDVDVVHVLACTRN